VDFDLVLVPVDGSDDARRAVEYALALADRYGAGLHLLHVLDERVIRGLEAGEMEAAAVAEQHRAFAEEVRERPEEVALETSSAAGFSTASLSRTPGSVVLDCAEEVGADFLVVPRETPSEDVRMTIGKAALYVLQYADQPVLSV
jgi:nucleotide-binding universal stress UspA family protein